MLYADCWLIPYPTGCPTEPVLNRQETQEAWLDWQDGGFAPLSDDALSDIAGGSYPKGGLC